MSFSVYIANTESLKEESFFLLAFDQASADRKKRILSLRFEGDKRRSLAVEMLLKKALKDKGLPSLDLHYEYNSHQKPSLAGIHNFYFSFSHSGDYAMCAVSSDEIGCDIEKIKESKMNVARRFFTEEEYLELHNLQSEDERNDLFFRFWTLKESFMKCTGCGMDLSMSAFRISIDQNNRISVLQSTVPGTFSFYEIPSVNGYKAAVCHTGNPCIPSLHFIDLKSLL